jgi:hypothetical protein
VPRGQEKVRIARFDLPKLSKLSNGSYGHVLRYRIISEDQNRFSHWSPLVQLEVPPVNEVLGNIVVSANVVQAVWSDDKNRPSYDVFVNFGGAGYVYHGTTPIQSYSFLASVIPTTVEVAVQVASIEKERAESITIFETTGPTDVIDSS